MQMQNKITKRGNMMNIERKHLAHPQSASSRDENRPPILKQKPLTYYFEQKPKHCELTPASKKKEDSTVYSLASPTPLKRARPALCKRIDSPPAVDEKGRRDVQEDRAGLEVNTSKGRDEVKLLLDGLVPLFPGQPNLSVHFGRVLQISQFLNVHRDFLVGTRLGRRISARKLLTAMVDRRGGDLAEYVLTILVNFLAKFKKAKPKVQTTERALRSRNVQMKMPIKPSLLATLKDVLAMPRMMGHLAEGFDELQMALAGLDCQSQFHKLGYELQILLLEQLTLLITSLDSFHDYMEEHGRNEMGEAQQRQAELLEKRTKLKEELCSLQAELTQIDTATLTRGQTAEMGRKEQQQKLLQRDLEDTQLELADGRRHCRVLRLVNKRHVFPLGQDRFRRLYWWFADSPDERAVFVQKETSHQNCAFQCEEAEDREEETFPWKLQQTKVEQRPCPVGHGKEEGEGTWWMLNTKAGFHQLLNSLSGLGLREQKLKRVLDEYSDLIEPNLESAEAEEGGKEEGKGEEELNAIATDSNSKPFAFD